jgi:outer membrane immunogenic protein
MQASSAVDLPMKAPPPPPVPVATWTGCYIDAGGGYGMWTQTQHTETYPGRVQTSFSDTKDEGWLGRFGAGCDYQLSGTWSNIVIGAFGDYDWMGVRGTDNFQNIGLGGVFGAPTYSLEKQDWAWSVGGRVGYLVTPALLTYIDAGYTETHFNQQNFTFLNTGIAANAFLPGTTYHGWFVGGGTEYAITFPSIKGLLLAEQVSLLEL